MLALAPGTRLRALATRRARLGARAAMASWTIEPPPPRSKLATGKAGGGALPVRTSETHPISVSWVLGSRAEAPPPSSEAAACAGSGSGGSLALCYCPGKRLVRDGVEWRRDMRADAQVRVCALGSVGVSARALKFVGGTRECAQPAGGRPCVGHRARTRAPVALTYSPCRSYRRPRAPTHAPAQRLRKDHGLGALVCLVSDFELRALGVDTRAYAAELAAAGIESVRFPIVEMAAPDSVAETRALLERVLEMMGPSCARTQATS